MKKLLSEVCTIQYGFPFDSAKFSDSNGMPLIRIRDVVRGYSETYTTEEYKSEYIVHENDLLIGMDGEFNIAKWGKTPALLNQRVCRLAPKDSIDKDYLFYFMPIALKRIEEKTPFVTVKHLSAKELNKIEIPVLSLEEQRKIAETLSKVDKLIAFRDQQLAKLDELVKARFVEMFGDCKTNPKNWKTKALEKIANVGSSKRVFVEELQDSGIPFYRGTEIGALAEKKAVIPALFITEEHYKQLCETTGKPQKGDLLMPSICPDGRIWIVDTDEPFYFKDGRVLWVHLTSANYNSVFLLYTLKDRIMTDYASIASGTTFAELKIFALKKCKIFDVPLELQNQFANFVERVDQQKQTVQQSLEKLELMKKALMQEYFG
ncbi:MAG TPA: restriction endonuclease subunit S [Oscillospiraceae bacterium]|nr:restriction endonuclease subunit S [Oscillospiraceae bacterium]